jgi:hypothetical protein
MAYRELTMIDVREVLRRWQSRQSIRSIARGTRVDRKTVRRYVAAAEALGIEPTTELTDGVVHGVAQHVQSRPEPPPSDARKTLALHGPRITQWLDEGLHLSRVHALLARDGVEVTYSSLRRFVVSELAWGKRRATVLLNDPPAGQEAQIDFAEMGRVHDPDSDRTRRLRVLIITLSFSRHNVRVADLFADHRLHHRGTGGRLALLRRDAQDARARQPHHDDRRHRSNLPQAQRRLR